MNQTVPDFISKSPFVCDDHVNACDLSPLFSVTRDDLVKAQQAADTLCKLFSSVHEKRD